MVLKTIKKGAFHQALLAVQERPEIKKGSVWENENYENRLSKFLILFQAECTIVL